MRSRISSSIRWLAAAAAIAAFVAVAVLLHYRESKPGPRIDERAGALGTVRLGETAAEVRARLGDPGEGDGYYPLHGSRHGSPGIPVPDGSRPAVLRYSRTAYLVSPGIGVFSMTTNAHGSRTRAGVAVGDGLDRVQDAYGQVECGEARAGEGIFGPPPTYRWCRATLPGAHVFFAGDPIESITLTRR